MNGISDPHDTAFALASPEAMLSALSSSVGAMVQFIDTTETIRWVSQSFATWFGLDPAAVVGRRLIDIYGAEAHAEFSPHMARAMCGEIVRYERQLARPDGTAGWISISLNPHRDASGKVLGVFASSLEVDDLKRTHDALDKALQVQAFHMDNSPLAVIEWDAEVRIRRWSGQAERIFGWRADEVVGQRSRDIQLVHPDWLPTIRASTRELLEGDSGRNRMISRNRTKSGKFIYCEWFNSAFIDGDGTTRAILSLAQDVTLRVEAEEQLRHAAVHDALTDCQNRQSLIARIEHALARARRTGARLALLYIDLDRFKPINDTHGHLVGDELLKAVAQRLRESTREVDSVARIGGDEFVVFLETDVDAQTPELIRTRIADGLAQGFTVGELNLACSASIGIARYPEDGSDPDQLLLRADQAMYRDKAQP